MQLATQDPVHLTIIIPTFNERENVGLVLWLLHEHLNPYYGKVHKETGKHSAPCQPSLPWEVVIVDDGSPDGTAEVVRRLQQSRHEIGRNVKLIQRPAKLGLGTAYLAGLQQARGQWVVLMDADLSHHPRYIPKFLQRQAATGCTVVCGTRYRKGGGVAGWGFSRKLTSRGANQLASTLLGASISDLTGAFRLYRKDHLLQLLAQTTCKGYAFQMEVAVRAQYAGFHVEEEPIIFVDRLFGDSKLGPSELLGFLHGLLRLLLTL
mmetsp:Transcript_8074/g.21489  ORF Transcript_8074/g.21489 Transcript_8074/m.21489 type:complete len:264 (-) Transcript_8074:364-1155(-)|eukprot:CAMPEP_0202345056 /NCGR_PEP_ID=MMETSP1126-20121109/4459_1 /ASSEMBLY_ACC=CAM_ASM_000457 /TAXON_ID=3047 /ORGANISM="Dunaliella tertiolecta, Strain CCMP1320" /LENGTH=263 /DNA_ID=CAMNT_0048936307 /DNA_START=108 /DNA_END=899 /DNA_ORIENTATION=+